MLTFYFVLCSAGSQQLYPDLVFFWLDIQHHPTHFLGTQGIKEHDTWVLSYGLLSPNNLNQLAHVLRTVTHRHKWL